MRIHIWLLFSFSSAAMVVARVLIAALFLKFLLANPEVTIKQGRLLGTTGTNLNGAQFYKFLGIPYAKPPLGSLRFKAPEPVESWSGTKNCTKDDARCVQSTPRNQIVGTEDCLYLNVFTQTLPGENVTLRPVMVAIHAGGFTIGSGNQHMQPAEYLLSEDVVLVSLNYRLGVFGFLSLEDTSLDVPGNAGLKDQLMALKWVQENIANFNGNPDDVTIFGDSAGGASVQFMMLSLSAKGLFHKGIMQSGSVLNPWAWGQKNAIQLAQKLHTKVTNESGALKILMETPTEQLFKSSLEFPETLSVDKSHKRRPFGPVIENPNPTAFLTEDPLKLLKNGAINDVPLMMGVCSNEGLIEGIYKHLNVDLCSDPLECAVPWMLNVSRVSSQFANIQSKVAEFYFKNNSTNTSLQQLFGDVIITEGVFNSAKLHFDKTQKPLYLYILDYETPMILDFKESIKTGREIPSGLPHSSDYLMLFKSIFGIRKVKVEEDFRAIRKMVKMWTNFARTGRPHPQWKNVENAHNMSYFHIGERSQMRQGPFQERMEFWTKLKEEMDPLNFRAFEKV